MDRGAWWATVPGVAESDMAELAHIHKDAYKTLERDRRQRSGRPMSTFRPLTFRESVARRWHWQQSLLPLAQKQVQGQQVEVTAKLHSYQTHLCLHPSAGRPLVGGLNPTP